jgi:hypothetical protein
VGMGDEMLMAQGDVQAIIFVDVVTTTIPVVARTMPEDEHSIGYTPRLGHRRSPCGERQPVQRDTGPSSSQSLSRSRPSPPIVIP